jgi:glycosyltransferase involved in cell wall biosynthesis
VRKYGLDATEATRVMRPEPPHDAARVTARRRRRLIHVTTVPETLHFLAGQPRYMQRHGFEVFAVSSGGEDLTRFCAAEGTVGVAIEMQRRITPLRDLVAVIRLWMLFRSLRPDIVHAHTPKGGLLGMLAAWLARVPTRIYHIHGLPFVTRRGWSRWLLRATERVSCAVATQVLCVSRSIARVATEERLAGDKPIEVLLGGAINGVDTSRFRPQPAPVRRSCRSEYGIPDTAAVIGFVGRLVREKGISELAEAWASLRARFADTHLLLVGPWEPFDPAPPGVRAALSHDPRVHLSGLDWDTPRLYAAMDVVVLPTYREGFPVVPLEAAAMELPVVATRVPGCTDAIVDGETGSLVPPRDPDALATALAAYLDDPALRRVHGAAARKRVREEFSQPAMWEALLARYEARPA